MRRWRGEEAQKMECEEEVTLGHRKKEDQGK